jgi:Ras-related protein Rab-7A
MFPLLKVVLLGDAGVGKTSLMDRFVNQTFSERYKATIGADFLTKELRIENKLVTLQIWDTAGCERFNSLGSAYFRGSDCCILVFDVTDAKSLNSLSFWKEEFYMHALEDEKDRKTFPFVVLANKIDMFDRRVVTTEQAQDWCKTSGHNISYFETSAKSGQNVESAFKVAVTAVLKQYSEEDRFTTPSTRPQTAVDLHAQKPNSRDSECPC